MARKRKTRATQAPQEPEVVQQTEPEPELDPEAEIESEPEHPQPDETMEEDVPGDRDELVEEHEEEGVEGEDEEEHPDNIDENKDDGVFTDPEKKEQETEVSDKPSENAVSEKGQRMNEEDDDEIEEEPVEKLLEPFSKDQLTLLIKEAVARHPDIIENVHRLADGDPSHCKIFVHGLGWEANSETITSAFGKYGVIEDCKVVKDKISGKSKGYAFILFKHRDGARRALKQPQKMIEGRLTSCQLASAGPVQSPAPAAVAPISGPPVSEYTRRKIYVTNVSADLDPRKLLEFFSKWGEIEEGPLGLDKETGKPKGFCLFVYKKLESAKKALEEPHKNFEGQILHCQQAVDGPKHTKGFFNQQHGQPQHYQQLHHQGHKGYYSHPAKKGKYAGSSGVGHMSGHLMAPSAGRGVPSAGFNQTVAPAAIGQAVAALLATQGAGLGFGNLLGGIGAGVNPQGAPPMTNNAGYGGQGGTVGYGGQPGMQGGYAGQQQMGQGGVRPYQGGAPYMGHGH